MFKETSRYAKLEVKTHMGEDGQEQAYIARRFLPKPSTLLTAGWEQVADGDRLDHVAHRAYGDPEQFWRLVDATLEFDPPNLTKKPGMRLRVPMVTPE